MLCCITIEFIGDRDFDIASRFRCPQERLKRMCDTS